MTRKFLWVLLAGALSACVPQFVGGDCSESKTCGTGFECVLPAGICVKQAVGILAPAQAAFAGPQTAVRVSVEPAAAELDFVKVKATQGSATLGEATLAGLAGEAGTYAGTLTLSSGTDGEDVTLSATAKFKKSGVELTSGPRTVKLDLQGPLVGTPAASPDWSKRTGEVTVTAEVSDPAGVAEARLVIPTTTGEETIDGDTSGTTRTFAVPVNNAGVGGGEGRVTFKVRAKDAVGNTTEKSATLGVDDKAPTIALAGNGGWRRTGEPVVAVAEIKDGGSGLVTNTILAKSGTASVAGVKQGATDNYKFTFSPPGGATTFTLEASDGVGFKTTTAIQNIQTDDSVPTVTVAVDNGFHARGEMLAVSATIADAQSGVDAATLTIQGNAVTGAHGTGDTWTFTFDPALYSNDGEEATLSFTVDATDRAGNTGNGTGSRAVDGKPPAITVPADNVWRAWSASLTAAVTVTIVDTGLGVDASTVKLQRVGAAGEVPGTAGTGANEFDFAVPLSWAAADAAGPLNFKVLASDHGDNAAEGTGSILVDDKEPAIAVTADASWYNRAATADVCATVTDDGSGLAAVRLKAGSDQNIAAQGTLAPCSGSSTHRFRLPMTVFTAAVQGAQPITVEAEDQVANLGSAADTRNYDDVAPSVTNVSADAAWFKRSAGTTVTATITDGGSGVGSATLKVTGKTPIAGTHGAGDTWEFAITAFTSLTNAAFEGALSFSIDALDGVSNAGTASGTRNVDDVAPTIVVSAPPAATVACAGTPNSALTGNCHKRDASIDITATVTATGAPAVAASVKLKSGLYEVAGTGGTPYAFAFDLSKPVFLLAEGLMPFDVVADDEAGNTRTQAGTSVQVTRWKWTYPSPTSALAGAVSSPAIASNRVYVGVASTTGPVVAVDRASGAKAWDFATAGAVSASPAVGGGALYVASEGGKVYALNLAPAGSTGERTWECEPGGEVFTTSPAVASAPLFNGSPDNAEWVFLGSQSGSFYAMRAGTLPGCTPRQTTLSATFDKSSVAVGGGRYFVGGGSDTKLHAFSFNGTALGDLASPTAFDMFSSPALSTTGGTFAFVGTRGGGAGRKVIKYELTATPSVAEKWSSASASNDLDSSPVLDASGNVFIGTTTGFLYSYSDGGTSASVRSGFPIPSTGNYTSIRGSAAVGEDGTVYFGAGNKKVYALAGTTVSWSYETGGVVQSSPAIACDGTLYIGSNDGKLYALITDSKGLANSSWPKFRRNNRNTGNVADAYGIRVDASTCQD